MPSRFLNNVTVNDQYTLPPTDGSDGQAIITDGAGNLTFGSAIASSAESAESVHISVKNTSGAQILKGTPVYVTGETGNSGKIEVAPADASDSAKMPALGLLESTLNNNGEGFCVQGGLLEGLATATIDGTLTTANDTVYVKSGGGLTMTKPTGTGLIQNIAKVARSHASNGSLVVSSILRTNDVPNLPTGRIWIGDGNTIVSDTVYVDEPNNRVGIGTTNPGAKLEVNGTINVNADGDRVFVADGSNGTFSLGDLDGLSDDAHIVGNASTIKINNGGSTTLTSTFNNRIGIGTTSPRTKLHVSGLTGDDDPALGSSTAPFFVSNTATSYGLNIGVNNAGASWLQAQSNTSATAYEMSLNPLGGNVGVGFINPSYKLDVNGSGRFSSTLVAQTNMYLGGLIYHSGDINTFFGFPSNDTFKIRTNNSDRIYVNSTGDVGIGTTSPNARLHVDGNIFGSNDVAFDGGNLIRIHNKPTLGGKLVTVWDHVKDTIQLGDIEGGYSGATFIIEYKKDIISTNKFKVGIDNSSPSYLLDVNGDGRVDGTFTCVTLVQTSQRDQKENISDINKSKPKAIPFKEYTYKSSIDDSARKRYGVIAEDIESDYPELVHIGADGIKGINYIDLLVKRVAELEKELEDISLTPGPKGNTGATGPQGLAGADGRNGSDGRNGADGNDHLKNVKSIAFNEKSGQLEIAIEGYKDPFRFNLAK